MELFEVAIKTRKISIPAVMKTRAGEIKGAPKKLASFDARESVISEVSNQSLTMNERKRIMANGLNFKVASAGAGSVEIIYADTQRSKAHKYLKQLTVSNLGVITEEQDEISPLLIESAMSGPIRSIIPPDKFTHHTIVHNRITALVREFKRHILSEMDKPARGFNNKVGDFFQIDPTDEELDEMPLREFGIEQQDFIFHLTNFQLAK